MVRRSQSKPLRFLRNDKILLKKIFDELVIPFNHDPGMMASIVIGRRSLSFFLQEVIRPVEKKQKMKKEVKLNDNSAKK